MTISVVLRLTLPALREGRLAGQVEIVNDGTRVTVRDADELVEAIRSHLGEPADGASSSTGPGMPPTGVPAPDGPRRDSTG